MTITISIGVLAYNESALISRTLGSLLQQSLFADDESRFELEIVVVPNGCTDNTASVAHATLQTLIEPFNNPHVGWKVCELVQAGKSNAWNTYVHQLCSVKAKYLFLMDADIEFLEQDTLLSMIALLERAPDAGLPLINLLKIVH
jgi:glycosyltransferase involved in cell wall biosynthesis